MLLPGGSTVPLTVLAWLSAMGTQTTLLLLVSIAKALSGCYVKIAGRRYPSFSFPEVTAEPCSNKTFSKLVPLFLSLQDQWT